MFSKQPEISLADLSIDLRDHDDWSVGALKVHDIPLDVTTLAIDQYRAFLPLVGLKTLCSFGQPEQNLFLFQGHPEV